MCEVMVVYRPYVCEAGMCTNTSKPRTHRVEASRLLCTVRVTSALSSLVMRSTASNTDLPCVAMCVGVCVCVTVYVTQKFAVPFTHIHTSVGGCRQVLPVGVRQVEREKKLSCPVPTYIPM